eukprot:Skav211975  [mRNA]  locus=scaffold1330:93554:102451:+ [translate_table: standard]
MVVGAPVVHAVRHVPRSAGPALQHEGTSSSSDARVVGLALLLAGRSACRSKHRSTGARVVRQAKGPRAAQPSGAADLYMREEARRAERQALFRILDTDSSGALDAKEQRSA